MSNKNIYKEHERRMSQINLICNALKSGKNMTDEEFNNARMAVASMKKEALEKIERV